MFWWTTGLEQGGGVQHRNKSPSGAFVSPRLPADGYCVRGETHSWQVDTGLEQSGKRAKAGYHRGGGILPFVIRGCSFMVEYAVLNSTNPEVEEKQDAGWQIKYKMLTNHPKISMMIFSRRGTFLYIKLFWSGTDDTMVYFHCVK